MQFSRCGAAYRAGVTTITPPGQQTSQVETILIILHNMGWSAAVRRAELGLTARSRATAQVGLSLVRRPASYNNKQSGDNKSKINNLTDFMNGPQV